MSPPNPSSGPTIFLASDIEGSTRLWEGQPREMSLALIRHDFLMRRSIEDAGGSVFKTVGDGFFASFPTASGGVAAVVAAQRALKTETWPTDRAIRVRMALHVGWAEVRDGDFYGPTINRLARLLSIGHGGQALLSESAATLARAGLPVECGLRDMGRHRLKDLDQAEAVSMLVHPELDAEFPPLKSLDALPNNLPRQLTSFVGREEELAEVREIFDRSSLVTLTGTGGTGKTRLALQMAADAQEGFPDGVWIVDLAPLRDEGLVSQAIAAAVGVREGTNLPLANALVEGLRDKATLLLLDNCEHLLAACASIVDDLLRVAPRLKVLATSREPLNLPGEALYRVPMLSVGKGEVKTAAKAMTFDAVRLLVDRARLSDPRFELTDRFAPAAVAICRRLDGIPLAIELAASRTKVLSLEGIATRLDDRFRLLTAGSRTALPRQQTLKATIDWSYELLEPVDQRLLLRVSVFAGGWSLEAAEAVCADDDLDIYEVLDGLVRLVDKSLVVHEADDLDARYRLLESVRQYGAEKLDAVEGAATRERHTRYYAKFVEEAEEGLRGPDQANWLERMEAEHDNVRSALAFCRARPDLCAEALSIVGAIGRFWTVRGYLSEGREWIEGILACAPDGPSEAKATAWRTAGQLAYWQGDSAAGRRFGEESLGICRALGDQGGEAKSLFRLGFACLAEEDLGAARGYFEAALELGQRIGDAPGIPHLLNAVGEVAYAEGNLEEAKARYEDALARFRTFEDARSIASVLKNLASVAGDERDFATAQRYLAEGLELRRDLGNATGIAATLDAFGVLAAAQGRLERATYLLAAAHALHEESGSRPEPAEAARIDVLRAEADASLGREAFDALWEAGLAAEIDAATGLAAADAEPAYAAGVVTLR